MFTILFHVMIKTTRVVIKTMYVGLPNGMTIPDRPRPLATIARNPTSHFEELGIRTNY